MLDRFTSFQGRAEQTDGVLHVGFISCLCSCQPFSDFKTGFGSVHEPIVRRRLIKSAGGLVKFTGWRT